MFEFAEIFASTYNATATAYSQTPHAVFLTTGCPAQQHRIEHHQQTPRWICNSFVFAKILEFNVLYQCGGFLILHKYFILLDVAFKSMESSANKNCIAANLRLSVNFGFSEYDKQWLCDALMILRSLWYELVLQVFCPLTRLPWSPHSCRVGGGSVEDRAPYSQNETWTKYK